MAKRRSKNTEQKGGAAWVMTFADLMSLLMAFFVMLYSLSDVDKNKFRSMAYSMRQALWTPGSKEPMPEEISGGLDTDEPTIEKKAQIQEKESEEPVKKVYQKTEADAEQLKKLFKKEVEENEIEISSKDGIIMVRLTDANTFQSGDIEITVKLEEALSKLATSMQTIDGEVTVSGYTDDNPIHTDRFRSNWELSASRAYSVIERLIGLSGANPERFTLQGFGPTHPIVPNDSVENRAKNRRIEIMFDQRDHPGNVGEIDAHALDDAQEQANLQDLIPPFNEQLS